MKEKVVRQVKRRLLTPRHGVRVIGVGAAKTGTHSFGAMYANAVSSGHELDSARIIRLYLDQIESGNKKRLHRFLRLRDLWRSLKIDASQINVYLIDDLEKLFPGSRYVLTVRPPIEWLRSIVDDSLRRTTNETWMKFRIYRFGGFDCSEHEKALTERGLFPLSGYLSYWRDAVERVVNRVPPSRMIVVRTSDLLPRSDEIAEFCGIERCRVSPEKARSYVNPTRSGVLQQVDIGYLSDLAERICGDLSASLFPDRPIAGTISELQGKAAVPDGSESIASAQAQNSGLPQPPRTKATRGNFRNRP